VKPRKVLWIVYAAEGRQAIVFTSKKGAELYISQNNAAPYGPEYSGPFRYEATP
jgi:hypothetical protein